MAQAARNIYGYGYGQAGQAPRTAAPQPQSQPDVRVIPGRRSSNPAYQSISPEYAAAFKLVLAIVFAVAMVCSLRVWLSVTTVAMLDNVGTLESTLSSAQVRTNELEIQHSILSSAARIEEEATKIGMVAPAEVKYLKLAVPGKVITNHDGSISLAGTLRNMEDYIAVTTG